MGDSAMNRNRLVVAIVSAGVTGVIIAWASCAAGEGVSERLRREIGSSRTIKAVSVEDGNDTQNGGGDMMPLVFDTIGVAV